MKYIAVAVFLIPALYIYREYSKKSKARLKQCLSFLSFIRYAKVQLSCYLKPIREIAENFDDRVLSEIGFIERIKNSDTPVKAFRECEELLSLGKEERDILLELFSHIGDGYMEQSLKLIDSAIGQLEGISEELKKEVPRTIKLALTLTATATAGLFILVM